MSSSTRRSATQTIRPCAPLSNHPPAGSVFLVWFYTLMVLSTALFDRAPFGNCICHGVVLDEQNKKLSKRLKNYPDPNFVFETYGADALRWYMMSSPLM